MMKIKLSENYLNIEERINNPKLYYLDVITLISIYYSDFDIAVIRL